MDLGEEAVRTCAATSSTGNPEHHDILEKDSALFFPRIMAYRCLVTPTCRHTFKTGHVGHFGKTGVQICLPKGTSKRLISTQNLFGNLPSRSSMVCSGVGAETNPHRFVTR